MIDFAVMAIRKGLAGRPTQAWLQAPWYGWLVIATMRLWRRQQWLAEHPDAPGWRREDHGARILARGEHGERVWLQRDDQGITPALGPATLADWVAGFVRGPDSEDALAPGAAIDPRSNALPEGRLWHWAPSQALIAELASLLFEVPDQGTITLDQDTIEVAAELDAVDFSGAEAQGYWAGILADVGPGEVAPPALIHRHQVWLRALIHGPLPADKTAIRAVLPFLYSGDDLAALLA